MRIGRNLKETGNRRNIRDREIHGQGIAESQKKMDITGRSNVAIAAAITAYARMGLTDNMMDETNPVYYHDTDSIVVQNPRPESSVGKELGQMKREYKIEEGIFAGPKRYSLKVEGGKEVIKAKGYGSKNLTFADYKTRREGGTMRMTKEY